MAEKRKINAGLKLALELGPIVAFFVAYLRLRDRTFTIAGTEYEGFVLATAGFIPLLLITTAILWVLTRHVSKMQIATAVLVVVFGGLTVWLNDERFFKMKPTAIYTLFAAVLGVGLLRGKSYLQYVLDEAVPLERAGWMILTRRLMLFFVGLAVLNEVIWRTMSTDMWVNFKTFGLTVAIFAFFMAQGRLFKRYGLEDGKRDG
ncbi:septation protein A [Rhodovulum sp. BSW8]|uniref:Inner membrane-spanning protein YciB n=1 Tax=Rhodovulum visakhapatnamense TaxID=364297 RepID=A0ABS1RK52_9RHOB|nr:MULTISPECIES: inner membrane-spanning protein YciB [Rhodovulum]MBL3569267.1 septation protein IspZ [Rhodovulum visakhapatnamense]MBL3580046.1 septation protein IspZ [Rhodovulum visakhapatnamense]OLS44006.1 intracellular septation protein A [Rhodovulum sulfidophilum]RBO51395.1 septation protein A [Rhodovulum sp. BSW8]